MEGQKSKCIFQNNKKTVEVLKLEHGATCGCVHMMAD